jgi:hypothetical protein
LAESGLIPDEAIRDKTFRFEDFCMNEDRHQDLSKV